MTLLNKKVEDFDKDFMQSLIDNKVQESKTLDYKLTLDISVVDKKVELLKDITSFYNTEGGVLIFGLQEEKDGNMKLGVPILPAENKLLFTDYELLKSQILTSVRSGTNPHISRLYFSPLIDIEGIKVFALGIPRNTSLPAMVTLNTTFTFHRRSHTDKYMPDTFELYGSFMSNHARKQDIERYLKERIDSFPGPFSEQLAAQPCVIIQILPLSFQEIDHLEQLSTMQFREKTEQLFPAFGREQNTQYGYSIQGLSWLQSNSGYTPQHLGPAHQQTGYTLLLRNGGIERAISNVFVFNYIETVHFFVDGLAQLLKETVDSAYDYYEFLELNTQFYLSVTIKNLKDKTEMISTIQNSTVPITEVRFPTLFFADADQKNKQLGLFFDMLWQAGGDMECPNKFRLFFFADKAPE